MLDNRIKRLAYRDPVADIDPSGETRRARQPEPFHRPIKAILVDIQQRYLGLVIRQDLGDGQSQAAGRAGHQRHLAGNVEQVLCAHHHSG
jgi:hypothetical protein